MRARLARLSKDSLIYGLGGAAARYTGLLLLPIYTRVFRPDEYGILESIVNLSTLLLAITTVRLLYVGAWHAMFCPCVTASADPAPEDDVERSE